MSILVALSLCCCNLGFNWVHEWSSVGADGYWSAIQQVSFPWSVLSSIKHDMIVRPAAHLSLQTASPPVIWFSPPVLPLPIFSQSIQTNSFNLCIRLIWNWCISYSKCTPHGISWPRWKCNLPGVQIHGSFFTCTHLWDCNRQRAWMLNSWFWQNTEIVKMWGILKLPNHLTCCSDLGSLNVPDCGPGAASKVWFVSLCLLAWRVQTSN